MIGRCSLLELSDVIACTLPNKRFLTGAALFGCSLEIQMFIMLETRTVNQWEEIQATTTLVFIPVTIV